MRSLRRRVNVGGLLTLAALVLVWEATIATKVVSFQYLPPPTRVAAAVVSQLTTGQLLPAAAHTITSALLAWLIALLAGIVLGVLLGLWWPARLTFTTSINVLRTLPVIAFIPIAALLFGLSTTTEITVAAWSALWPILVNTIGAVNAVHPRLHEVAEVLHITPARRIRTIVLPGAAPLILVGARLGLSLALIVTVATEMIANPAGLGYQIVQMQQALRPDAMFAYVLVVGVLGMTLNAGLLGLAARAAPDILVGRGRG